jgi:vancomycin resistance protein YoaR
VKPLRIELPDGSGRRFGQSHHVRAAVALAGVAVALTAAAVGLRVAYADEVLPGTRVAGIALGGLSQDVARGRLATAWSEDRSVTVIAGKQRVTVHAGDVAFRLDAAATAARAVRAGRHGPLAGLGSEAVALLRPRDVQPVVAVDRRRLAGIVAMLARGADRPSFLGALSIDRETRRVDVAAPRAGRVVDRPSAEAAILAGLRRGSRTAVTLAMRTAAGPRLRDVRRVARQARSYLARPLRLTGVGDPVTVTARQLAALLDVRPVAGSRDRRVRLGVKPGGVAGLVGRIAARRDRAAVNARVVARGAAATIDEKLDMSWRARRADVEVVPARGGRRLQRASAAAAIDAAVADNRHLVRLAVRSAPPAVSTGAARLARRLIGTFTTYYDCCQPRVTNIRLIARAVDGAVIAPQGRFSLNAVAGRRTRTKGYVPAPFIADGELVPSVGGGVSQFSTTMYNAAYFAGLDIDSHQPHSVYIARYPPGREATLDYGSIDLTWTNDTEVAVFVRASSTPTSVTVSLYGDNGGRRVRAQSGPRQPLAGRDFAITVTRRIRYRGGRIVRQPYITRYDTPPVDE